MKLEINHLCKDTARFMEYVQNEPDRSVPIIAVAFLDDVLEKLLEARFLDNKKVVKRVLDYPGSLSNFAARTDVAYCLGLISSKTYKDIGQIRSIRNKFSHSHKAVSFNTPEIADMCKNLHYASVLLSPPLNGASARSRFLTTAIMLVNIILLKALSTKGAEVPKEYEVVEVVKA